MKPHCRCVPAGCYSKGMRTIPYTAIVGSTECAREITETLARSINIRSKEHCHVGHTSITIQAIFNTQYIYFPASRVQCQQNAAQRLLGQCRSHLFCHHVYLHISPGFSASAFKLHNESKFSVTKNNVLQKVLLSYGHVLGHRVLFPPDSE